MIKITFRPYTSDFSEFTARDAVVVVHFAKYRSIINLQLNFTFGGCMNACHTLSFLVLDSLPLVTPQKVVNSELKMSRNNM